MDQPPTPIPRRSHLPPTPPPQRVTWGVTLGFFVAGLWSLVFAQWAPLPGWLALVCRLVGFLAIFVGLIAAGTDIDNWRKARRHG